MWNSVLWFVLGMVFGPMVLRLIRDLRGNVGARMTEAGNATGGNFASTTAPDANVGAES